MLIPTLEMDAASRSVPVGTDLAIDLDLAIRAAARVRRFVPAHDRDRVLAMLGLGAAETAPDGRGDAEAVIRVGK